MTTDNWMFDWLARHGLEEYAAAFAEQAIDRDILPKLSEQDLKDLGLRLGDRKRFMEAVQSLARAPTENQTSTEAGQAERRQLTILFCDLVGSTALSQSLDPETLRELMRQYQQTCRDVITKYDGHIAQYLGDGLMVYFGFPRAHEDNAERAARAALDLVDAISGLPAVAQVANARFQVRIGIATGTVVVGETGAGDASVPKLAVGETPNLAARLQGLAAPDQIVIGPSTHRLLGSTFEYANLGAHTLKGIVQPVHAWQVLRVAQVEGRFEATRSHDLTRLVGRDTEISLLLDRWQQAQDAEGQVVLLSGEAGIGKSRISRALIERTASEPQRRMRYQCSPYRRNSSLHPVIEHLQFAAKFGHDSSADEKLDKLESLIARDAQTQALMAELLSLPTERYPALNLSSEKRKEKTLDALIDLVLSAARAQPVLMIMEDVHWIDPTTQELLDVTLARISDARVLLILTHRPEYVSPWKAQPNVTTLALNRLTRRQGGALIAEVTHGKPFPDEVNELILAKTDGVPLFVEELIKTVRDGNYLRDAGDHYELTGALPTLAIPSTLQDSLMARLDRDTQAKEVAQIGACIGREFSAELLAAVSAMSEPALVGALRQLLDGELVYTRGNPPALTYIFKHALVQDAAYASLLKTRRAGIHEQIAQKMLERAPKTGEEQPEVLAHHFTEAGRIARGIEYWHKAGQRAAQRLAYREAINHFRHGIELCPQVSEQEGRASLELQCHVGHAYAHIPLKGWTAAESFEAFSRARELCAQSTDNPTQFAALAGLSVYHMVRGEVRAAVNVSEQSLAVAIESGSTDLLVPAYAMGGSCAQRAGALIRARDSFEEVIRLYDPRAHGHHAFLYGQDPLALSLNWNSIVLWSLGYPDSALKCAYSANVASEAIPHPVTRGFGLNALVQTYLNRREPKPALAYAEQLVELGNLQGLPLWTALGMAYRAVALISMGNGGPDEIGQAQEIIKGVESAGAHEMTLRISSQLADALLQSNRLELALPLAEPALERVRDSGFVELEPAFACAIADAITGLTPSDSQRAEQLYLESIDAAKKQEARSPQLRAAIGLATLWNRQGKHAQARELLAPILAWFTEGHDTPDLIRAKALLEGVSP